MDAQLLMKTAALAGELMLKSGAETYRVEDTMSHIMKNADNLESSDVLVIMTGITATLKLKDEDAVTVMRRVENISTNLNVIVTVNEISRDFCNKKIDLEEAYSKLSDLKENVYTLKQYNIGIIAICVGFVLFFGGSMTDVFAALIVGFFFISFSTLCKEMKFHDFLKHVIISIGIAFVSMLMKSALKDSMNLDIVMISAIMPLVPGMAITNAVRDTLKGDYLSGAARILEAFLRAAGIAIGIGLGIAIFGNIG